MLLANTTASLEVLLHQTVLIAALASILPSQAPLTAMSAQQEHTLALAESAALEQPRAHYALLESTQHQYHQVGAQAAQLESMQKQLAPQRVQIVLQAQHLLLGKYHAVQYSSIDCVCIGQVATKFCPAAVQYQHRRLFAQIGALVHVVV